jgi:hypothetical protein
MTVSGIFEQELCHFPRRCPTRRHAEYYTTHTISTHKMESEGNGRPVAVFLLNETGDGWYNKRFEGEMSRSDEATAGGERYSSSVSPKDAPFMVF